MKNLSKILISLLMGVLVFFSACEDDNDYDYDAIEPIVQGIVGPTEVKGGTQATYMARGRAGSEYDFSSHGAIRSITPMEDVPYGVVIDFDESFDDEDAILAVVETTIGGVASEEYKLAITVAKLHVEITGAESIAVVEDNPVERTYSVDFKYPNASYNWSITGDDVSIVGDANDDQLVVLFDYPEEDVQYVQIDVVVTTANGNDIEATLEVEVLQFCPLIIDEMIGNWVTESAVGDCPITAVVTEVDEEEVTITMHEVLDFYTICTWGDSWEVENGLKLYLNEPEGTIHIPEQFYGYSDYPESFWIRGVPLSEDEEHHGEYNFCVPTMTIRIEIIAYWDGGIEDGVPVDPDGNPVDPDDLWDTFGMFADPITLTYTLEADEEKGTFVIQDLEKMIRSRQ